METIELICTEFNIVGGIIYFSTRSEQRHSVCFTVCNGYIRLMNTHVNEAFGNPWRVSKFIRKQAVAALHCIVYHPETPYKNTKDLSPRVIEIREELKTLTPLLREFKVYTTYHTEVPDLRTILNIPETVWQDTTTFNRKGDQLYIRLELRTSITEQRIYQMRDLMQEALETMHPDYTVSVQITDEF